MEYTPNLESKALGTAVLLAGPISNRFKLLADEYRRDIIGRYAPERFRSLAIEAGLRILCCSSSSLLISSAALLCLTAGAALSRLSLVMFTDWLSGTL